MTRREVGVKGFSGWRVPLPGFRNRKLVSFPDCNWSPPLIEIAFRSFSRVVHAELHNDCERVWGVVILIGSQRQRVLPVSGKKVAHDEPPHESIDLLVPHGSVERSSSSSSFLGISEATGGRHGCFAPMLFGTAPTSANLVLMCAQEPVADRLDLPTPANTRCSSAPIRH